MTIRQTQPTLFQSSFQNRTFNTKMENHSDSMIPQMITKQEALYDDTIIKIQNFVELISETLDTYGTNIINSKERFFLQY